MQEPLLRPAEANEARVVISCRCGCGLSMASRDNKGRLRRFAPGHQSRVNNPGLEKMRLAPKPPKGAMYRTDGHHWRTSRWRARQRVGCSRCAWESIGGCKGAIDAAHIDGDFTNGADSNLLPLCKSHHRLLDSGRIDPSNPVMPAFRMGSDGKRRYSKSQYWNKPRRAAAVHLGQRPSGRPMAAL